MLHSKVSYKRIAILDEAQADMLNDEQPGYWDDNGGETDGGLYICAADDAPEGAEIIDGYEVEYSGQYQQVENHKTDFCGWSSRSIAYTANPDTANAIALEEEIAENEALAGSVARSDLEEKINGDYVSPKRLQTGYPDWCDTETMIEHIDHPVQEVWIEIHKHPQTGETTALVKDTAGCNDGICGAYSSMEDASNAIGNMYGFDEDWVEF